MAILYVLWSLGLLGVIAVSFLSTGSVSHALSHTALTAARRQAAAEAAVTRAVLGLLDPRPEKRWRVDGIPQEIAFGDLKMQIAVQDELGRIDLNQADQGLLAGLLRSVGLTAAAAAGLADKILDWREAGPGRRLNGAKDSDYRAAGHAHGPRNGPFQSIDELHLVMGVSKDLYSQLEPALTVYSGRQFIDPQFAPREALLALPMMSRDAAAATMAARTQSSRGGIIDPAIPLGGRAFTVRAQMPGPTGAFLHEAVVRLNDHPSQPYWVLRWTTRR